MIESMSQEQFEKHLKDSYPVLFSLLKPETPIDRRDRTQIYHCITLFGIECGRGWWPIIDRASKNIESLNQGIVAVQIKEKFGGLRFYTDTYTEESDTIISLADEDASMTCEQCGERGTLRVRYGWYSTNCTKCSPDGSEEV